MNQQFGLQPFPTQQPPADLTLTGYVGCHDHSLNLHYRLEGIDTVVIPPPAPQPLRQDQLWQDTCFEFFLGVQDAPDYWEFNLSPAGHWNVYRFTGYRQGMADEMAFESLPFTVQQQANTLTLDLHLDLQALVSADQPLEMSVTTVIKRRDGEVTYWAIAHTGPEADFHRRDSFGLKL